MLQQDDPVRNCLGLTAALPPLQAALPNAFQAVANFKSDPRLNPVLERTDRLVGTLLAALPPGAALVLFSGQGNTPLCRLVFEGLVLVEMHGSHL